MHNEVGAFETRCGPPSEGKIAGKMSFWRVKSLVIGSR